jgi:hypothetical protein
MLNPNNLQNEGTDWSIFARSIPGLRRDTYFLLPAETSICPMLLYEVIRQSTHNFEVIDGSDSDYAALMSLNSEELVW